ncbi:probable glutamate receptor isoform X2 [Portunus trituberculatus]|uniref:probable glutamate receptor isoform X2 n=1 Tax=Portunus trituberculatus TaxID=210409 RepID=UPI001E1CD9CA|nr:probable glutamate receptor isoform X2 [Portunus trituberculatus]
MVLPPWFSLLPVMCLVLCAVSVSGRLVIEVVVDAGSPLAARAAKDLQESVLFPLSQEMFLNITYLSRMLQDSPSAPPSAEALFLAAVGGGSGGGVAGVVVVIGCCTDAYVPRLADEVPVLSLQLVGERCRGVPAAPGSADRPPFKELQQAGFPTCAGGHKEARLDTSDIRLWVKAIAEGKEPIRTRRYRIDLLPMPSSSLSSSSSSSSSSSPFPRVLPSRNNTSGNKTSWLQKRVKRQVLVKLKEEEEEEEEAKFYNQRLKSRARDVLSGTVMTVSMKHRPPYVTLVKKGRIIAKATGILLNVLDSFAATYNFSYVLKLPDDDQWGSLQENGWWTGMVGEVHRREVEMALGPTSITEAREKAIDFTMPFDYEPWDILIPESIVTVDLTAYLFPFAGLVWSLVMVSTLVVGILAWVLSRIWGDRGILYPAKKSCKTYSFSLYVFDTFGCLVQQANKQPQTGPIRMLVAWWWVFCVVLVASYSSKLISSLTVRFTEPPVKSLKDLVESRKLLWTYLANSAMEEVFKFSAPDTLFGKVGQLHKDNPGLLVYSFEEGVTAVRSKKFAYFEDNSWLEFAVADDLALHGECRMTVVRDPFFYTRFGIILQQGSPYRDAFSYD